MSREAFDPSDLSAEAWEKIAHAMATGVIPIPDGDPITLKSNDMVTLLKYVASLNIGRKKAGVVVPDIFLTASNGPAP